MYWIEDLKHRVRDEATYEEKLAVILESWTGDFMTPHQVASEAGYETAFSKIATQALAGNWIPAWYWCATVAERFGDAMRRS